LHLTRHLTRMLRLKLVYYALNNDDDTKTNKEPVYCKELMVCLSEDDKA